MPWIHYGGHMHQQSGCSILCIIDWIFHNCIWFWGDYIGDIYFSQEVEHQILLSLRRHFPLLNFLISLLIFSRPLLKFPFFSFGGIKWLRWLCKSSSIITSLSMYSSLGMTVSSTPLLYGRKLSTIMPGILLPLSSLSKS